MNQTIRKRIEDIKNGVVPEGYKKTKAGIVPIEWEEKRIGDVLTQRKTLRCVSEDAPLLSFTIEEGVIEPENKKSNKRDFLIKDINTKKFALTEVGDIIYNPANLKFGAIHRNNLRRGVVSPIYGIFYGAQNSEYMGYLLRNQRFIDYAKIYAEGTVEKLKTLGADTFKKLKITLPWLAEQEKIAEILETQDKVIKLKEKLIEQKKQQKEYLMQQLLTGKKRLPGFMDEWNKVRLGEIASMNSGGTPDSQIKEYYGGKYMWVSISDMTSVDKHIKSSEKTLTKLGFENCSAKLFPAGTVLFAMYASIGECVITEKECCTSQAILGIEVGNKILNEYLYYFLLNGKEDFKKLSQASSQPNLNKQIVQSIQIKLPSIEEQKAIVDILSKADEEIELLQKDLEEEKNKKKALMQLLLTGIVRVS